jgi:hypothetical protein
MRCLPTFLLVGFTKTGSTAFFQYAQQHPFVRMARGKETSHLGARTPPDTSARRLPNALAPDGVHPARTSGTEHGFAAALDRYEACAYCERGEVRRPPRPSARNRRVRAAAGCRTWVHWAPNPPQPTDAPLRHRPPHAGLGEPGLRVARRLACGGARRGVAARRPHEAAFLGAGADRAGGLAL